MTEEARRKIMQRIHSADTSPERRLRLALWHRGLRYRKNWRALPGSPDIALTRQKIAIFVDGDFWHARGILEQETRPQRRARPRDERRAHTGGLARPSLLGK